MKRTAFIATMLCLATSSSSLYAQTHTPQNDSMVAKGWTFVASLDSVAYYEIATYGDTIFVVLTDPTGNDSGRCLRSIDGGKSFDTLRLPATPDPQFAPTEPIIFVSNHVSRNLGVTFDTLPPIANLESDPTSPGTIYGFQDTCYQFGSQTYCWQNVIRSEDTGHTWDTLRVPILVSEHIYYQIDFDARQHGLWYLDIFDRDGGFEQIDKTTDNGNSFTVFNGGDTYIFQNPPYEYGVGCSGEVRKMWSPDGGTNYRGVITWGCGGDSIIHDWVDSLLPGRPDTIQAYNGNEFNGYFFHSVLNPDFLLMSVGQVLKDPTLHSEFPDSGWYFFSPNGGSNWKRVYADTMFPQIWMDTREPSTLWASTFDVSLQVPQTWYLYKKSTLEGQSNVSASVINDQTLELKINGTQGILSISYTTTEIFWPELVDVLGRQVAALSEHPIQPGDGSFQWVIPGNIPKGVYYLIARGTTNNILKAIPVSIP